ncbi:DUF2809 domain-containing protein [Pedosphaera parvula]|uniref:ribosomal maturation YjgA family protein n=1 Tax=Pedosphaera parvula TaxID=1032527 RepID=UPI000A0598DE|nr:DUF2809 domain-containing protein [Pedosphaera parvula]
MTQNSRSRLIYGVGIIAVIGLGLASRHYSSVFPLFIGDILWALMVFLGFGFIFPSVSTLRIAAATATFSASIEISQLYHAPWIDAIRHTRLGGLILGFEFLWSDLLCYGVGILMGIILENAARHHFQRRNTNQPATK